MKKYLITLFLFTVTVSYGQNLPPLQTQGTHFVNRLTQEKVVLKGVNVSNSAWGFWEWPLSDSLAAKGSDPLIRPVTMRDFVFTLKDVDHLRQLQGNVVRYQINYELFAAGNSFRDQNIADLRRHIHWLDSIGVYTIVCLSMPPGLDVSNDNYERDKSPDVRLKSTFESDSIFTLWRDMWQYLAGELEDLDAVAGYELLNEPRKPALADATPQEVTDAYLEVIDSIRAMDSRHILFICEFNSREANPGEQYWSNSLSAFVTDTGEQGIIWDPEWLKIPRQNIAYVAHVYSPFEFTLGQTSSIFNPGSVSSRIDDAVNWAYESNNAPLFISEYGVNYYHTHNGNDTERLEWLGLVHSMFEQHHISSSYFQYKDFINPWTDINGTLGIWQHFYDESTIAGVSGGEIIYTNSDAEKAAENSGIDEILNSWFIENSAFVNFSTIGNGSLINELIRYFTVVLGTPPVNNTLIDTPGKIYFSRGNQLIIEESFSGIDITVGIYDLTGRELYLKNLKNNSGKVTIDIFDAKVGQGMYLLKYRDIKKEYAALVPFQ